MPPANDRAARATPPPPDGPDRPAGDRRPRICHLITRLILGGAQRIALAEAAYLRGRGWDVELWCGPETGAEGSLHAEARRRGVAPRVIPSLVRLVDPVRDLRAYFSLAREFRRSRFTLVHTHSSKAGILGRLAACAAGVPLRVHSVHGWGITPDTGAVTRHIFLRLERLAAARSHLLCPVSLAVRDAGLAWGIGSPAQYRVIHGGIEIPPPPSDTDRRRARAELDLPLGALVLGTIGRLDDAKDPTGLLTATLPLLRERTDAFLVFVGDGKLREPLEREIAAAGCASRVRLAGRRPAAARLAAAFDIFVLASRWEGFPLVVIEAMAAGCPVVAYDVAGVREALVDGETGHLVPAGDGRIWHERLATLAASPPLRARMGAAGRRSATERFSQDRMLRDTETLYQQLLESRWGARPDSTAEARSR